MTRSGRKPWPRYKTSFSAPRQARQPQELAPDAVAELSVRAVVETGPYFRVGLTIDGYLHYCCCFTVLAVAGSTGAPRHCPRSDAG